MNEEYKVVRLNILAKVHPDELPAPEGSAEYYLQLLRLLHSSLLAEHHNSYIQRYTQREMVEQDEPDISGQGIVDISPPPTMSDEELRFLIYPKALILGSREWRGAALKGAIEELEAELARRQPASPSQEGKGEVIEHSFGRKPDDA